MNYFAAGHVFLITLSNLLVQYPFTLFGLHTTWGAFSYPAIFILTDLTTRLSSPNTARKIIFKSMFPGLIISYLIASYLAAGHFDFSTLYHLPMRVALACFIAYTTGQLLDIVVFQRYRQNATWWLAPALSSTLGNVVDTFLFFSVAFYHSTNPFLSEHWPEIAGIDLIFKIIISLLAFVPAYGILLKSYQKRSA